MKPKEEITLVEIFSGTTWQVGMVKSLLEDEEIEAYLKDDIIGTLSPWWAAPGGVGSIKVMVSSPDFDKARTIVEGYVKNL